MLVIQDLITLHFFAYYKVKKTAIIVLRDYLTTVLSVHKKSSYVLFKMLSKFSTFTSSQPTLSAMK